MKTTSLLTAFGSASILTVSLVTNISPALSANLAQGTFNISGGTVNLQSFGTIADNTPLPILDPFTDFKFTNIDGTKTGNIGQFTVGGGTGDFTTFLASGGPPPVVQSGVIKDLDAFTLANLDTLDVPAFLDFTFTNAGNTFDLDTLGFATFDQTDTGFTVSIGGTGTFNLVGFDPTPGTITFGTEITVNSTPGATTPSTNITSIPELKNFLSTSGNLVTGVSWSAEASTVQDVPEPTSMIGLVAFGLASAGVLGRKKTKANFINR